MKVLTISIIAPLASAFPHMMDAAERDANPLVQQSIDETNCGPLGPCLTFDAKDQFVSTTGDHAYQAPSSSDIRGPCPGLNAAANHGYLPRNGIAHIADTVLGMQQLYSMGEELSGFLAAYAVAMTGDPLTNSWSIGGPLPDVAVLPGGIPPQGISYSHNAYEGDTSLTRADAYLNNGDAHSLIMSRFKAAYSTLGKEDRLTLDKLRQVQKTNQQYSVMNNPYYFAPLFSTTLVVPAAHNFIVNFMSNHSAEEPSGYLDGNTFKSFFAVSGNSADKFVWNKGQERIPDNWYRRPTINRYGDAETVADLVRGWAAYPDTFRFGGNTNGVNTYEGVNIANFSGGAYTNDNILLGNNFACLLFQTQQQAVPDALKGLYGDATAAINLFNKYTDPLLTKFNCSQFAKYDAGPLDAYPGRKYKSTGTATNY